MRLLQRRATVKTRYGGGFVQCVNGLCGGADAGRRVDWFYFVNGVEASKGAASVKVGGGDHVWWDRRSWEATDRVPAVVGSFPEPFLHGTGDEQRLPGARRVPASAGQGLQATPRTRSCTTTSPRRRRRCAARSPGHAARRRRHLGRAARGRRAAAAGGRSVSQRRVRRAARRRPAASRCSTRADGRAHARCRRRGSWPRRASATAASRSGRSPAPTTPGVAAAVRAFNAQSLKNHYAVAVEGATVVPVPITAGGAR